MSRGLGDVYKRQVEVQAGGGLDVEVLAPTGSPSASVTIDPTDSPSGGLLRSQPTIQPRSAWATRGWAGEANGCDDTPSDATNIRAGIVHHTVTANSYSQSDVPNILRAIYRLHVDSRGWCDIAYNFIVDRFGTIWEARTGSIDRPVIGGHAKGFNTWSVGVALLGQHQTGVAPRAAAPTPAAQASVERLLSWKLSLHGVDPSGTTWLKNRSDSPSGAFAPGAWVHTPTITTHAALGTTSCPGNLTIGLVPGWRAALSAERNDPPPYVVPARTAYEHGPGFVTLDERGGTRASGSAAQPTTGLVPSGRRAVAIGAFGTVGMVLLDDGRLVGFGGAPDVSAPAGARAVADIVVRSGSQGPGTSGWVLATDGRLFAFGGAPSRSASGFAGTARAAALDNDGRGYVLSERGLFPVGGAPAIRGLAEAAAVDLALRPNGVSGWVVLKTNRLVPFGGAPNWQPPATYGGQAVNDLVAGHASLNGHGGWVADREGRVVPFGDERPILPVNSSVGKATIVDAALPGWILDDGSEMIRFTRSLTELVLGTPASRVDADWLGAQVVYVGRSQVVENLAHSDAWAGTVVDDLYRDVLGRPADAAGRAYWVARQASGLRTQDLAAHFYASPEYDAESGGNQAYVRRLYRALLAREPDSNGLAYWTGRLEAGAPPGSITAGFYQSIESRRARVRGLYTTILGRSPDVGGLEFWSDRLLRHDDIALAVQLASSAEYWRLATQES